MNKNHQALDMINGPLFKGILIYALPLIFSGVLQILYNSADLIVVGRFAGSSALAAVGATTTLIHLVLNIFINFSVGASVSVATDLGAKNYDRVKKSVHTAYFFAGIAGIVLLFVGILLSMPLLRLIKTPESVISDSALYMRIYFLGAPASLIYNFGSAILNASGETKKPLYYLTFSGIVNVILNLILVIVFRLSVAGVAIATITSQYISAFLVTRNLIKRDDFIKLNLKEIGFYKNELLKIIAIGFPAGLQGAAFSLSNTLIQSSINIFGETLLAGNTAATNVEAYVYTAMNGVTRSTLTFCAQNVGAGKFSRLKKILLISSLIITFGALFMAVVILTFSHQLLGLYVKDALAVSYGVVRLWYIVLPYFVCGLMENFANVVRASGYSLLPAIATIIGVCGLRILWIFTVFAFWKTPESVYLSYIVSWAITTLFHAVCVKIVFKKQLS